MAAGAEIAQPVHAHAKQDEKAHRYELVEIPEHFGPRELLVDEARVKAFAFAQDDYCAWHFGDSPFGGPVAHSSLLANELMQIYFERYRIDVYEEPGAWLQEAHVEETMWFESPLRVGERAVLHGRFVEKYVKNGHGAVVLEGEARGEDGRLIMGHRALEYFALDGPAADTAGATPSAPMRRVQPRTEATALPGAALAPLEKTISFPQQLVFSTLDHPSAQRSVHTDFSIARRAGLQAPLVQGQQLACHACEALERFFGPAWYTSGRLRVKFLGAVAAGQTVRVCGAVLESDPAREAPLPGTSRVELDVWIEAAGDVVAVAEASACPFV